MSAEDTESGMRKQDFRSDTEFFAWEVPKAELHVHLEGTMEAELAFELAKRNGVVLPFSSPEEVHERCKHYDNLDDFLDLYMKLSDVVRTREDFRLIVLAYLERVRKQGVRHVEIFLDPQTHLSRGLSMTDIILGPYNALEEGSARYGITFGLIPCILRQLSEEEALSMLQQLEPFKQYITAVGLAGSEKQHPPSKFTSAYKFAKETLGLHVVAHAGEEGGPESVWGAIRELQCDRIDHGVRAVEDDSLIDALVARRIPLTMCPLSNVFLQVTDEITDAKYPLKKMLDRGVCVTVNSDDPAFFGSNYVGDNFVAVVRAYDLTKRDVHRLALNSIEASFADPMRKAAMVHDCQQFFRYYAYESEGSLSKHLQHSTTKGKPAAGLAVGPSSRITDEPLHTTAEGSTATNARPATSGASTASSHVSRTM
jgi:adenosine deaminase